MYSAVAVVLVSILGITALVVSAATHDPAVNETSNPQDAELGLPTCPEQPEYADDSQPPGPYDTGDPACDARGRHSSEGYPSEAAPERPALIPTP
jgi:hypothetical protein